MLLRARGYNQAMRCWPVVALCLMVAPAFGQEQRLPNVELESLPAAPAVIATTPAAPPAKHPFWDHKNILLFSGVAVFRGLDYASTRNFQARGRTEVLLPDDVVNNSAGFAALEAAATATSVGISYIFHRTGHHKMERWLSIGHISVTAFGVVSNYSLESVHPR